MKYLSIFIILFIGYTPSYAFASDTTRDILAGIISIFRHDETALTIAGIMIIIAVMFILNYFHRVYFPIKNDLTQATKAFAMTNSPEKFFDNFDKIKYMISEQKNLLLLWEEYNVSMSQNTKKNGSTVLQNTMRPQDFFTLANLTRQRDNVNTLDAWPQIFIGIGLLFTFLGLIAAINQAGVVIEVASQDVGKVMRALELMLTIASFKFLTSVAGIFCSILITIFSRELKRKLYNDTNKLHEKMEKCFEFLSIEQLQLDTIVAIKGMSNSITKGVTDGVTKIAGNELRDFANTLGTISTTLANLQNELIGFGKFYTEELTEELKKLKIEFGDTFSLATSNLEDSIAKFSLTLAQGSKATENTLDNFNVQILKNITESLTHFEKINKSSSNSITSLTTSFENASDNLSSQISRQVKQSEIQFNKLDESAGKLTNKTEKLISELSDVINAKTGNEDHILSSLLEIKNEVSNIGNSISINSHKIQQAINTIINKPKAQENHSETLLKNMLSAVMVIQNSTTQYNQKIEELNKNISFQLSNLNNSTTELVKNINQELTDNKSNFFDIFKRK